MSQRINEELEKLEKTGINPKAIHVGVDLYNELSSEINRVYIAPPPGEVQILTMKEVTEYKGIPVEFRTKESTDYLEIIV